MSKQEFSFGKLSSYGGGAAISEGTYALNFEIMNFAGESKDGKKKFASRLGVMVTAYPINDKGQSTGGEAKTQFLSMGSKANLSFAPNPKTGKGLVVIPGGPAQGLPGGTNWQIFLKSLYDAGLPEGTFDNDISVLDGLWAHLQQVPEPAERKSFAQNAATSEAGEGKEEPRGSGLVPVVSEFIEGGKPWENGGGIPEGAPAVKANGKATDATVAVKGTAAKGKTAPAATKSEDPEVIAMETMGEILSGSPEGISSIKLKTEAFKMIEKAHGADMAEHCKTEIFDNKETLGAMLAEANYALQGIKVVPVA